MPRRALQALAAAWLFSLVPAASPAAALTGEEFLNFCAGERGPVDLPALKKALADGAEVNFQGPRGQTPLMAFVAARRAAGPDALAALRLLLAAGADPNARSEEGGTSLGYALSAGAGPDFIAALLSAGADPNGPLGRQGETTPLQLALSLEPDPLVSALLLTGEAGAGPAGEAASNLAALAAQNPNPRVRLLLEGYLRAERGGGLPLFAAVPPDPDFRARLKELETQAREGAAREPLAAGQNYLRWQADLPLNVAARRELWGRTETEAWLEEYAFHLAASAGRDQGPAAERMPRDRLVLPARRPRPAADDALAADDRRVAVLNHLRAGGLLAAYETASGRELWRRRLSGPAHIFHLDRVLLAAVPRSGGLGEALVLDPLTGAEFLRLTDLDDPKWTVDAGRRALIVSTDFSLDIFDLAAWKNRRWSWRGLLENLAWDEARNEARAGQNAILAEYGERLDDEGRFSRHNADLFPPGPAALDRGRLEKARAALRNQGHDDGLELLATADKNYRPSAFVLGPAGGEAERPLILVNAAGSRLDALAVPDQASGRRFLTRARLKFSPGGRLLAAAEDDGALHFFDAADQGRWLGGLTGSFSLGGPDGPALRDLRLAAVLDDGHNGRPLVLFQPPGPEGRSLLAELDLAGTGSARLIGLQPAAAAGLTAGAVGRGDQLAVGLADGGLRLITPQGPPASLEAPPGASWSALAFSGDGQTLAAAAGGDLYLFNAGRRRRLSLDALQITRLALDQSGRFIWAALAGHGAGRVPALALVDAGGAGKVVYRPTGGQVLSLRPDHRAGRAAALVEPPSPAAEEPSPAAAEAGRWEQGRADLITFDPRPAGPAAIGLQSRPRRPAGLSPGGDAFFYQEPDPEHSSAVLARLAAADRRAQALVAYGRQDAPLGEASFDSSGRLALFPEAGEGGGFYIHNLAAGRELARSPGRSADSEGLLGAAFLQDPRRLVTFGRQGVISLWELRGPEPRNIWNWVFLEDGSWAAAGPEGLFETESPESQAALHWATAGRPVSTLPLSRLTEDCLRPGLSAEMLAGRPAPPPPPPVAARDLSPDRVRIADIIPTGPDKMAVAVTLEGLSDGLDWADWEIRFELDGRPAARARLAAGQTAPEASGRLTLLFRELPAPPAPAEGGRAVISAYVVNGDLVRSPAARAAIKF